MAKGGGAKIQHNLAFLIPDPIDTYRVLSKTNQVDPFQIHQINDPDDQQFDEFWRIYNASFPLNEKRTLEQQTSVFNKPDYRLSVFISDYQLLGFISFWTTPEFIFIEHLAVAPELRNRGIGKTILEPFIENYSQPVILEIELPVDNLTIGRLHFYESLGFQLNEHEHSQPPYHKEDEPVPMKILSYKKVISEISYQHFKRFQNETVMG